VNKQFRSSKSFLIFQMTFLNSQKAHQVPSIFFIKNEKLFSTKFSLGYSVVGLKGFRITLQKEFELKKEAQLPLVKI